MSVVYWSRRANGVACWPRAALDYVSIVNAMIGFPWSASDMRRPQPHVLDFAHPTTQLRKFWPYPQGPFGISELSVATKGTLINHVILGRMAPAHRKSNSIKQNPGARHKPPPTNNLGFYTLGFP